MNIQPSPFGAASDAAKKKKDDNNVTVSSSPTHYSPRRRIIASPIPAWLSAAPTGERLLALRYGNFLDHATQRAEINKRGDVSIFVAGVYFQPEKCVRTCCSIPMRFEFINSRLLSVRTEPCRRQSAGAHLVLARYVLSVTELRASRDSPLGSEVRNSVSERVARQAIARRAVSETSEERPGMY